MSSNTPLHLLPIKESFTLARALRAFRNIALIGGAFLSIVLANFFMFFVWATHLLSLCSDGTKNKLISVIAENCIWGVWVFGIEKLMGLEVEFSGDKIPANENAIVISNHVSDVDWIPALTLAKRKGMLGHMKFIVKESLKYIPFIGTGASFMSMIFLKRNWTEDQKKISQMFDYLIDHELPVYIVIYPEGTRISPSKYKEAIEFANERGITPLEQVLVPRRKGFSAMVKHFKGTHVKYVYDITAGYVDGKFSHSRLLKGVSVDKKKLLVNVKRWKISDIPVDDEKKLNDWLMEQFYRKDRLISGMKATRHFPGEPIIKD